MDIITNWPPSYNVRLSRKARHAHLKVIPNQGLEVVIPVHLQKIICVEELLSAKKTWIQKHLSQLKVQPLRHIDQLKLAAIGQTWLIEYKATTNKSLKSIVVPHVDNKMTIYGPVDDITLTHKWLTQWLKKLAQEYILPILKELSEAHNLPYNKATIRAQQTLWGSCNADKNINLNYKLLFLPKKYVEHILLHELAHTKYLDHSKRFWNLLNKLDPQTDKHNAEIKHLDDLVPFGL